jgi:hypothetical protein
MADFLEWKCKGCSTMIPINWVHEGGDPSYCNQCNGKIRHGTICVEDVTSEVTGSNPSFSLK